MNPECRRPNATVEETRPLFLFTTDGPVKVVSQAVIKYSLITSQAANETQGLHRGDREGIRAGISPLTQEWWPMT